MDPSKCNVYFFVWSYSHSFDNKEDNLIRTIRIDNCIIRNIVFSKDATNLFCGCDDGLCLLITVEGITCISWLKPGKELWRSPSEKKHEVEISRVYCVDDKSYFSGDFDGVVKVVIAIINDL